MIKVNKFIKTRKKKIGLPPGTPVFIGEKELEEAKISILDYDETQFQERKAVKVEECFPFKETSTVTWINICGLHDVEIIEKIGAKFDLHPLILEDIVHTQQRPKMEEFDQHIFIVMKMLSYDEKADETQVEQVSLILGRNYVISFQEQEGDIFDPSGY